MQAGEEKEIRHGRTGNDILVMKKEHPCGAKQWLVLRSGMDFRLRCTGCGHELMIPRSKAEKSIRQILRGGKPI